MLTLDGKLHYLDISAFRRVEKEHRAEFDKKLYPIWAAGKVFTLPVSEKGLLKNKEMLVAIL